VRRVFEKGAKYFAAGFCLALVLATRSLGAGGPLKVEGVVKHDTAWSGSVLVEGDVLVPQGVTLTVSPGTTVIFMPSDSTKIEPMFLSMQTELLVRGVLKAEGSKEDPIRMSPAPEALSGKKPERGDWGGVIFDGPASSASVLSHVEISKADTAVAMYGSSPSVTDCLMEDCRYGVVCIGGGRPRLAGSTIAGCDFALVGADGGKPSADGVALRKNGRDFLLRD